MGKEYLLRTKKNREFKMVKITHSSRFYRYWYKQKKFTEKLKKAFLNNFKGNNVEYLNNDQFYVTHYQFKMDNFLLEASYLMHNHMKCSKVGFMSSTTLKNFATIPKAYFLCSTSLYTLKH